MGAIASQITSLAIVYSTVIQTQIPMHRNKPNITYLLTQTQIKENITAPRHWPLCGEFTGDRWIPAQMASNTENVSIW